MTDSTLNKFVAAGTAADRGAFTPSPPTPASGAAQGYFWHETDTGDTYSWKAGTGWIKVNGIGTGPSTSLSQISSSLSGAISSTTSLSSAVSAVDSNQSTSLSQVSSSLSGAISSTTSLSTAVSTVDSNQSTSISSNLSKINSLSTAVGAGGGTTTLDKLAAPVATTAVLTEQFLYTYTLPGGTLASNGQSVRMIVAGSLTSTTRSRNLTLYFGSTSQSIFTTPTSAHIVFRGEFLITRTGAATQLISCTKFVSANNGTPTPFGSRMTPAETLSGNVDIKLSATIGAGVVASDLILEQVIVELIS